MHTDISVKIVWPNLKTEIVSVFDYERAAEYIRTVMYYGAISAVII